MKNDIGFSKSKIGKPGFIIESNEESLKKFYIEPLTGQIGLTAPLDYEEKQTYDLVIVS